jgi:hypothetical protein
MTHSNNDTDKNNDDDSNDIQDRYTVNQQFGHGNGHVDRGYSPVPTHYIYIHRPRLSKYHQKMVKVLGLWGQTSFFCRYPEGMSIANSDSKTWHGT